MKQSIKTWKVSHGKFLVQIQKSLADPRLVFDSKKHSICFGICFDLELRNAKANRKERIPSDFQHIFPMCSSWFLHKILIPLHVTMNLMKMKELSSDYFQNLLSSVFRNRSLRDVMHVSTQRGENDKLPQLELQILIIQTVNAGPNMLIKRT